MQGPEKNSYKEFDNEKKFLQLENSPPPHNFSNGPSLNEGVLMPTEEKSTDSKADCKLQSIHRVKIMRFSSS